MTAGSKRMAWACLRHSKAGMGSAALQGFFVTDSLKECLTYKKFKNMLAQWDSPRVVWAQLQTRRSVGYIIRQNTKFVLCLLNKMLVHTPNLNLNFGFLPMQPLFFLFALNCWSEPPFDTGGCSSQQLTWHSKISAARWRHENYIITFLHILSSLLDTCNAIL